MINFLIGFGLSGILLLIDILFFHITRKSNIRTTLLYINVTFFIGILLSILYIIIIGFYFKNVISFDFMLGLFASVIASIIFKVIKSTKI